MILSFLKQSSSGFSCFKSLVFLLTFWLILIFLSSRLKPPNIKTLHTSTKDTQVIQNSKSKEAHDGLMMYSPPGSYFCTFYFSIWPNSHSIRQAETLMSFQIDLFSSSLVPRQPPLEISSSNCSSLCTFPISAHQFA